MMRELIADNLDDATAGRRTAPLVVEAPAPRPKQVAQAKKTDEPKARAVRTQAPKQPPVVLAGSNQPIRPIPVKTMSLDADGNVRENAVAQANAFAFSNLGASDIAAVPILPPHAGEQPVVVAQMPLEAQQAQSQPPVTGALAYSESKPHPLSETPRLQAVAPAQKPLDQLSETEELEIEAQAIAAERKEDALMPPVAQNAARVRRSRPWAIFPFPLRRRRLRRATTTATRCRLLRRPAGPFRSGHSLPQRRRASASMTLRNPQPLSSPRSRPIPRRCRKTPLIFFGHGLLDFGRNGTRVVCARLCRNGTWTASSRRTETA